MACEAIHTWSFCDLVGAFLDLAIVYLLLCGSTLAFFASKFLGFFGLCLPCPCNGLFGNPDISICLQRLLVDCPIERVSSVQLSVKNKFPFDSIWAKAQSCQLNLKLVRDGNYENGRVEFEGEASCSSVSESLGGRDSVPLVGFGVKEGRFDVKGKGVVNSRPRYGLRRRRKCAVDYGKFSSVSSYDPPRSDVRAASRSTSSVGKIGNEIVEESLVPVNSGDHDDRETPMVVWGERVLHEFELNEPLDENNPTEKDSSSVEEFRHNARRELGFDGNEKNAIRILEQALEEELAARSALYLELEKERSAAATAADEAMAMILRLQEEKGSIEMEARQYQRIIEEKSAYDAEEMNILKEILLRREREKYVLEKEVEAYRQMMFFRSEQLEGDVHDIVDSQGQRLASSLDSSEDPVLMLQRLSDYIAKKEKVKNANRCSDCELTSVEKQNCILALGKELPIPELDEDADFSKEGDIHSRPNIDKYHPHTTRLNNECHQEFQEKGMVSMDENPYAQQSEVQRLGICSQLYRSNSSQEPNLREKTITLVGEEQEQNDNTNSCQGIAPKTVETHNDAEIYIPYEGEDLEKHGKDAAQGSKDPLGSIFDTEPRVHDVHVIDDESNLCSEVNGSNGERRSVNATLDVLRKCDLPYEVSESWRLDVLSDCPTTSRSRSGPDVNRISADMISGLPPMGSSRGKALLSDLRRNSMSAVDNERLKIDTEVGWLRERLRIVQEGREKLNFSVEHREREKIQLQLLEDIAHQLREIRQLTEPGKAVRQASLPLPSSKVTTKKRRCRSVSLGVHQSS